MRGKRNPFVAREGLPFLALALCASWLLYYTLSVWWALPALGLVLVLYLVFRDPRRRIPSAPLGVVSPVDGTIVEVGEADKELLQGKAHRILIRINSLGSYTARSPVEGKIMGTVPEDKDLQLESPQHTLWLMTDEGDEVVLKFRGYRFGIPPKSFARYGERLGQGSRCAYLRLARFAEVHFPASSKVLVEPGERVTAGMDLLARLLHP